MSGAETACTDDHCVTCSDEGRPGVLVAAGVVRTADGDEAVDLTLVPAAVIGDRLLVHAGFAIAALGPSEPLGISEPLGTPGPAEQCPPTRPAAPEEASR